MKTCLIASLVAMCFAANVSAGEFADDSRVVAERGGVSLSLQDVDLALEKVPMADRPAYVASTDRMHHLLDTELLNKQIARLGREMKLVGAPPIGQSKPARDAEQLFVKSTLEVLAQRVAKQDFALLASEYYQVNQSEFTTPTVTKVQEILVSNKTRSANEVKARVNEVVEKANDPAVIFDELVTQYSDGTSAALGSTDGAGMVLLSKPGEYLEPFELAVNALKAPGDITGPVETEFGAHVLKLISRESAKVQSFADARNSIIEKLETDYADGVLAKFYSDLRSANPVFHADVIELVRDRYGKLPDLNTYPVESVPQGTK